MTVRKYGKELAEMSALWNCGEREAAQQFLQAHYIARGNSPKAAADFINCWNDDDLARSFVAVMASCRGESSPAEIDLLELKPTRA